MRRFQKKLLLRSTRRRRTRNGTYPALPAAAQAIQPAAPPLVARTTGEVEDSHGLVPPAHPGELAVS